MAAVSVRQVTRRFGAVTALDGVSLDIADGAFVTLLGASGCGKSTLLRIIAGLDAQDAGEIMIGGGRVDHLRPRARDVAMVFQSYALYPYMTVAENISLPLVMRRLSFARRLPGIGRLLPGSGPARRAIWSEVRQVADALEISALLHRKPAQLSGGQRQRVALARAMVRHPQVFLMDEPLSNLDARLRVQARAEIAALHRRLGTTFLYVTHDQAEAMTMSDMVAVMQEGRILQYAPPQALYDDPDSLDVARFVGQPRINSLAARIDALGRVLLGGMHTGLAVNLPPGPVTLAVRPEAFRLVRAGLPARVSLIERLGPEAHAHLLLEESGETVIVRLDPAEAAGLALDAPVQLRADAARALLFDRGGTRIRARVHAAEALHA
jgi:multiple sugar transport system ATP-binding protein